MRARLRILLAVCLTAAACSSGGPPGDSAAPSRTTPGIDATPPNPPAGSGGDGPPPGAITPDPPRQPSTGGDAPPQVSMAAERGPDASGWYSSPVSIRAAASDDTGLADVCLVVVPNYPDGTGASAIQQPCGPVSGTRWSGAATAQEEARNIVQFWAVDTAGQQTNHDMLDLKVDLTPPEAAIQPPPSSFAQSVRLSGEARDAASGTARVDLVFEPAGGGAGRRERAACACAEPAFKTRRPPSTWEWSGTLPSGEWTVRVEATDHAGHAQSRGPTARFTVT